MDTWLRFFERASEGQLLENPLALAAMLDLTPSAPQVAAIQANLSQSTPGEIDRRIDEAQIWGNKWPAFVSLCKAYIHWCADIDPDNLGACFESYARVFLALQQAFSHPLGSVLNDTIRQHVLAIEKVFLDHGKLHVEWIAAGIFKFLNAARSEREVPSFGISKRDNVLFYANTISRAFFKSKEFISARGIYNNMPSLNVQFSQFPLAQQVEYRYWVGRYCLHADDIEMAYVHLSWAFARCSPQQSQYYQILDYLILPAVLTGHIPGRPLLDSLCPEAQAAIEAVCYAMKRGVPPNYAELAENKWVRERYLWPVVEARLPLLVYRKAIHRLAKLSGTLKLPLELCRPALHFNEDPDLVLTEGVMIQLIATGLVVGKLLPRAGFVTLKSNGSVPPLVDHFKLRIADKDAWLLK